MNLHYSGPIDGHNITIFIFCLAISCIIWSYARCRKVEYTKNSETVEHLAKKDKNIICITPAMTKGSKLEFFKNKFPNRTFDVGIAEQSVGLLFDLLALLLICLVLV